MMTRKPSEYRRVLFISISILAGLILIFLAYFLLIDDSQQGGGSIPDSENDPDPEVLMVTIPFKAEFAMHYVAQYEDIDRCGELPWRRIIVEGAGTEPNLGKFNVHMEFCVSGASVYCDLIGWFVPAEGDSLFITTWGQVMPPDENDPPYYTSKWDDPFEFTGGTGRFEGVTGGGMTHCYNSTEDDLNHHTWEGSLTMKAE